jgi:hypothetical protein
VTYFPERGALFLGRRARGILLRLVRRRRLAAVVGLLLMTPAAWLQVEGQLAAWWVEGLCLVFGATGAAFLWMAVTGARPDWIEPSE